MSFTGMTAADVAGFVAAQDELRATAGTTVSFGVPSAPQWPDGTAINPDTGVPFDATAVQSNAEYTFVDITVLIVEKQASPLRPQADTAYSPSGEREGMDIILDVATEDYEQTVANASVFTVLGVDFQIEEAKPFGMGGTTYRWLVYGGAK